VADTVQETILARLQTVFKGITTVAGYNRTIYDALRYTVSGAQYDMYPSIGFQAVQESVKAGIYPVLEYEMTVIAEVWQEMEDGQYLDKELNILMGDMQKAIMLDPQLNNLCRYCALTRREYGRSEGAIYGVGMVTLEIGYAADADDPTTGK